MLFFNDGPTLIVVSPAWAALAPILDRKAASVRAGIYIDGAGNATAYKFNVKKLAKIPDLQRALAAGLGTSTANRVVPSPTGPIVTGIDTAKLTLSFRLPAGAPKNVSGTLAPLGTGGLPYALRFGPGTQALVATSGLALKRSAKLKAPKKKAKKIVLPAAYTLYYVTSGSVAVVCGQGFCGSLQTEDPTATGCAAALAGQYGSGLGLRTPCSLCKDAGFRSYSDTAGAPSCAVCTGSLAANSAGTGCGNLVATSSSLSIDPATCTPQLINDTASAYADFLKAQPEVVPETVAVTVTCLQVGTGVSLTIAASYQGSSASASATVNLFTQCCPSPGGAACAGTPCDSPLLKPLNITGGGQGQANATDPCLAQPCNVNGGTCTARKGEPNFSCTCEPGYANVFGTTCSECATGFFIQSGAAGSKDVVCASKCVQIPPYCNPNGTTTCTAADPPTCACKPNYSGPTCSTCAPNFFPTADGAGVVCSQCASQCASCATNATNCVTCSGTNFAAPGCTTCLPGFYIDAGGNCASALYNTFPETGRLPGSYASLGVQATSTRRVGQRIVMKQGGAVKKLLVVLTSWACETGGGATCATTPGSSFSHPITVMFQYFNGEVAGNAFYTQTKTVAIPYRPSANASCSSSFCSGCDGSQWFDAASGTCRNGFNTVLEFDLTDQGPLNLPQELILAVSYPTETYGDPTPVGTGGPWNSLNVAFPTDSNVASSGAPLVQIGTTYALFWSSTLACSPCTSTRVPCGSQGCSSGNRVLGFKQADFSDFNDRRMIVRIE